ncbi:SgcJ/EcaC family oxidoreductase [Nonomuraea dietziae]|uniref:SgcJ/EcaC family oxidoreductase n=1 Tax=Nonomuraea dietziae TaxID=65515 RepID=UPI00341FA34A
MNHLLRRLTETWNAGDATAYAALFTDDADYITYFGLHLKGRQAIEDSHRELFKLPIKLDTPSAEPLIRRLSPEVQLAIVQGGSNGRPSIVSFAAVETAEGLRFAFFQNTRVSAP